MKIKENSFRELRGRYLYLAVPELAGQLASFFASMQTATGLLCYCYLEHEQGLQFEVLCGACFESALRKLQLLPGNDGQSVKLPYESVMEAEFLTLPEGLPRLAEFAAKVARVQQLCIAAAELEKTRQVVVVDHLRRLERPDEILVQLVRGELAEGCYVRLESLGAADLSGTLVSEPQVNFGLHAGDRISFYLVKNVQGIMCMAIV